MKNEFVVYDLYVPKDKKMVKSAVKSLTCYICKKELNGISITAKIINGKSVFLCSHHYKAEPYQIVSVS
jgi:hypothetical protein